MTRIRSFVPAVLFVLVAVSNAWGRCPCDCDDDGKVVLPEIVLSIGIVLGSQSPSACPNLAPCPDGDSCVAGIHSLVMCVQNALHGCPPPNATPEPSSTPTPTPSESTPSVSASGTVPPKSTATPPLSTPTPTPTCTPPSCTVPTCGPGAVLHFPDACSCPFCATPTRTPTRTQTPTTTACRNVAPAAAPVTSPTEALTQDIFFCGIERSASQVNVEGAVTDRNKRRSLTSTECPLQCPNPTQQCYAQPVQLQPNTTHHIRIVQGRGICGGSITVEEDVFGDPLTIRQVSLL